jgi:agmatine deiminase
VTDDRREWPGHRGYRLPAEWSPHAATWLSWPHNRDTWPDCFAPVEPAMVEVVRALAQTEMVRINVRDTAHAEHVTRLLAGQVASERIRLHVVPTNDAWIRDHGAIFLVSESADDPLLAVTYEYNAWGGKYPPYDLDRVVARQMAQILDVPGFAPGIVLEGGSIDCNGAGVLLTTEQCLLNPNRNPELDRAAIEQSLRDTLGVAQIIWLGEGIAGDDTDGHIDDLTRFVALDTVVTVVEPNRADPNHAPLLANRRHLDEVEVGGGRRLNVVELPMPEPLFNAGQRLPASYANFYIANESVLVPVFACPQDDAACAILTDCFSGRRIVPIDSRPLVAGLGALHCLTQQVPSTRGAVAHA